MKDTVEFIWNHIYVEWLGQYMELPIKQPPLITKHFVVFHILPVGPIRKIPIGFKGSKFYCFFDHQDQNI